jgi:hypothetical protein
LYLKNNKNIISGMKSYATVFVCLFMIFTSCGSEDEGLRGCTDSNSSSYNPEATEDDGSCAYPRDAILGTYDGTFANCSPDNNSNNFNEPKNIFIDEGDETDEVKVVISEISAANFSEKKVLTFVGTYTGDQLKFDMAPSSDRWVIGEIGIRLIMSGTMKRSGSGDLNGQVSINVFDEGDAMTSVGLFTCELSFNKK